LVITGHTSGIGEALYQKYGGIGLSKSTGFDISKDDIEPYLKGIEVFVNNAWDGYNPFSQTMLLQKIIDIGYKGKIINIGTNTMYNGNYKSSKVALETTNQDLFIKGYDTTLIKLGKVDTPRLDHVHEPKILLNDIIDIFEFILHFPHRIEVISTRPDRLI